MESGRCAKSWGTGKCHSCFKLKEKVDSKNCIEVPLGDLGKNQNWIVREKPEKKHKKQKRLQSPGGSKILLRMGRICLSSLFLLIILKYGPQ